MVEFSQLEVGTKLKAAANLIEAACGEHPALEYAVYGDILVVRKLPEKPPVNAMKYVISVSHEDVLDRSFLVGLADVELA